MQRSARAIPVHTGLGPPWKTDLSGNLRNLEACCRGERCPIPVPRGAPLATKPEWKPHWPQVRRVHAGPTADVKPEPKLAASSRVGTDVV